MKKFAKWVVILWSLFCLFGVVSGVVNVGKELGDSKNEYEEAGTTIGIGCGMGIWVGIWLAIAGPGMFVYLLVGNKEKKELLTVQKEPKLCTECGKYYEGNSNFCPHCGKKV
jgi:hypothetical protein